MTEICYVMRKVKKYKVKLNLDPYFVSLKNDSRNSNISINLNKWAHVYLRNWVKEQFKML